MGSTSLIRMLATDLDGTLLRDDGTIAPRTRAALARAHDKGIAVVVVTARAPRTVRLLAREAGLRGLAICTNGALVYDLTNECVAREVVLQAAVARQIILAVRAALPGCCFATEAGLRYGQEPDYAVDSPYLEGNDLILGDALTLCADGLTKLIVRHRDYAPDDLLRQTRDIVGRLATVTHSGAPFVEIAAPGVTKATALAALCAERGIAAAEVLAFGDMPNDLPLLEWAGRAVAVANAHPAVLAAADLITASNEEDGVARVIESVVRGPWSVEGFVPARCLPMGAMRERDLRTTDRGPRTDPTPSRAPGCP